MKSKIHQEKSSEKFTENTSSTSFIKNTCIILPTCDKLYVIMLLD